LGLKKYTNVKNKNKKGIFNQYYFERKIIRFKKKIKIMLQHFPIGFGLVVIFLMSK